MNFFIHKSSSVLGCKTLLRSGHSSGTAEGGFIFGISFLEAFGGIVNRHLGKGMNGESPMMGVGAGNRALRIMPYALEAVMSETTAEKLTIWFDSRFSGSPYVGA